MQIRTALITGASSGIGYALSQLLDKKGIALVLHGTNIARLDALSQTLSVPTESVIADLTVPEELEIICRCIREKKPDLVINGAGIGFYGLATALPIEEHRKQIALNISALVAITHTAVQTMLHERGGGVVLNISSAAAFFSFPYFATYAASKAFVTSFSEALDFEMRGQGVAVLNACPGRVTTRFRFRASHGNISTHESNEMSAEYAAEQIWKQICKRKRRHIFSFRYRVMLFFAHIFPQRLIGSFLKKFMKKYYHP